MRNQLVRLARLNGMTIGDMVESLTEAGNEQKIVLTPQEYEELKNKQAPAKVITMSPEEYNRLRKKANEQARKRYVPVRPSITYHMYKRGTQGAATGAVIGTTYGAGKVLKPEFMAAMRASKAGKNVTLPHYNVSDIEQAAAQGAISAGIGSLVGGGLGGISGGIEGAVKKYQHFKKYGTQTPTYDKKRFMVKGRKRR